MSYEEEDTCHVTTCPALYSQDKENTFYIERTNSTKLWKGSTKPRSLLTLTRSLLTQARFYQALEGLHEAHL